MTVVEDSEDDLSDIPSEAVGDYRYDEAVLKQPYGPAEHGFSPKTLEGEDTSVHRIACESCGAPQDLIRNEIGRAGQATYQEIPYELCESKTSSGLNDRRHSSYTVDEQSYVQIEGSSELDSEDPIASNDQLNFTRCQPPASEISRIGTEAQLRSAKQKIDDLEEELLELKADMEDQDAAVIVLQREVAFLRAAQRVRDEQSGFPVEELIEQYLNQQERMLADLKIREDGTRFTSLIAKSQEWFGNAKVDEGFHDVYSQSRQALCRSDYETVPFVPALVDHDELLTLVGKCSAISLEARDQLQERMCTLSGLTPGAVIRSLITAALAEWVFDTNFPKFDECSSEMLTKYRELLAMQGS